MRRVFLENAFYVQMILILFLFPERFSEGYYGKCGKISSLSNFPVIEESERNISIQCFHINNKTFKNIAKKHCENIEYILL